MDGGVPFSWLKQHPYIFPCKDIAIFSHKNIVMIVQIIENRVGEGFRGYFLSFTKKKNYE